MVERPIKKSERQVQPTNDSSEASIAPPAKPSHSEKPSRVEKPSRAEKPSRSGDDRKQDRSKGRKGSKVEEPKAGANLALMRGPKPTKPTAPVEEPPDPIEETTLEADVPTLDDAPIDETPGSEDSSTTEAANIETDSSEVSNSEVAAPPPD